MKPGLECSPDLLRLEGLKTSFFTDRGVIRAVNELDLSLQAGKILGLIGESGSGKSVTALSIMGMVPAPGRMTGGKVFFQGQNLLEKDDANMSEIRGDRMAMIFQDPMTSLDPVFTVGELLKEVLQLEGTLSSGAIQERSIELLERVGIPAPALQLQSYPFQLSGGMRQRVMIALALSRQPDLLIADEPTTALDVTIQAQILELIRDIQRDAHTAVLFITHDFAVIAQMADQVGVMYAGRLV